MISRTLPVTADLSMALYWEGRGTYSSPEGAWHIEARRRGGVVRNQRPWRVVSVVLFIYCLFILLVIKIHYYYMKYLLYIFRKHVLEKEVVYYILDGIKTLIVVVVVVVVCLVGFLFILFWRTNHSERKATVTSLQNSVELHCKTGYINLVF